MDYLTKSDAVLALGCPTRLHYRRNGYPEKPGDDMAEDLVRQGHAVGALARLYWPEGVFVGRRDGLEEALARSREALRADRVVLFEAPVRHGNSLVYIDVLEKEGEVLRLFEVKAKGLDPAEGVTKGDALDKAWEENVFDAVFQAMVLADAFPGCRVEAWIMGPDKTKPTRVEGLPGLFRDTADGEGPDAEFTGTEHQAEQLRAEGLLHRVDVTPWIQVPEWRALRAKLEANAAAGFPKIDSPTGRHCLDCPWRDAGQPDGFGECWSDHAIPDFPVWSVYRFGNLGTKADAYLETGRLDARDLGDDAFRGSWGERRRIQVDHAVTGTEYVGDGLADALRACVWPLHFFDVETMAGALPPAPGLRPHEPMLFQWSCHTVSGPDDDPVAGGFLHLEPGNPDRIALESLRRHIGEQGSVLVWSSYEQTQLKRIRSGLPADDPGGLGAWIDELLAHRLVDLEQMALAHYFHPRMGKSSSIKYVLPAVLASTPHPDLRRWLEGFAEGVNLWQEGPGGPLDPYGLLPPGPEGVDVREGTGAMRAYRACRFGPRAGDTTFRREVAEALDRYCRLDTLAMVLVWKAWRVKAGLDP